MKERVFELLNKYGEVPVGIIVDALDLDQEDTPLVESYREQWLSSNSELKAIEEAVETLHKTIRSGLILNYYADKKEVQMNKAYLDKFQDRNFEVRDRKSYGTYPYEVYFMQNGIKYFVIMDELELEHWRNRNVSESA